MKARETTEVVIGAVAGPITAPTAVIAGLYRPDWLLRMVGRSTSLTRSQARTIADLLNPPATDHRWPDSIVANRFGSGQDRAGLTKVDRPSAPDV